MTVYVILSSLLDTGGTGNNISMDTACIISISSGPNHQVTGIPLLSSPKGEAFVSGCKVATVESPFRRDVRNGNRDSSALNKLKDKQKLVWPRKVF